MPDRENVIEGLESLRETIRTATQHTFTSGGICAMNIKRIDNALAMLKEQDTKHGKWRYCEDVFGQDGYQCSECGFFEPWYYDFEDINFITDYQFCPSCGSVMQEGR